MFDVGFWELMLIGVVALVVIGPERLPGVARTAGKWVGKGKRMLTDVKAEIDQELKAEELKRIVEVQKQNKPLQEIIETATDTANEIKNDTEKMIADLETTDNESSQSVATEKKSATKAS